jgi:multiple sugar transport system permease protein
VIDQPVLWLSFDNFAGILSAIVIAESWRATALVLVILIAGLQLIPRDFFEAADLFGANRLRRTVHVVLPLLRPSLQSALIIRTIFAFQTFAVVFALAGRNMPVLAGEAYTWYATNRNEHVAAAYAVVVMGLTVVAIVVYLRVLGFREAEVQR